MKWLDCFYLPEPSDYYYLFLKKAKKRLSLTSRFCQFLAKYLRNNPSLIVHVARRILYNLSMRKCGKRLTVHEYTIIKNVQMMEVGNDCVINPFTFINALQGIKFGNNVTISSHCSLVSQVIQNERMKKMGFNVQIGPEKLRPIKIGNNSWLATGCLIGPGVIIGKNCQIGANSVVLNDLPDNCFAAGTPAKVIRELKEKNN